MKYVLETSKIDINVKNNDGTSILHLACESNENFLVPKYLIEEKNLEINVVNKDQNNPLHRACKILFLISFSKNLFKYLFYLLILFIYFY